MKLKIYTIGALIASGICCIAMASNTNLLTEKSVDTTPVTSVSGKQINPEAATAVSGEASNAEATSQDSINVTVNVTYANKSEKVSNLILLPKDITRLGFAASGKKDSYTFRVPKNDYEMIFWGSKENYRGNVFHYTDNLKLDKDTVLAINTADCNIETSYTNYLPNGEVAKQDLYLSSTKTVAEAGNCHNGTNCFFAARHTVRNVHLNHSQYMILHQKLKDTSTAISDTKKDPHIWCNTKNMPLEFIAVWKYLGKDGVYAIRYDINNKNFGDSLTNKNRGYRSIEIKYNVEASDSIPSGFNPKIYNNNGFQIFHNGMLASCSTGYQIVDSTDVKNRYWIDALVPYNGKKGYDFALNPGISQTKLGTATYGYNTLPITMGEKGIIFLPIQYVFSGLKIWAGSDGSQYFINDLINPRLNADENTEWGKGFPYASFYPAMGNKASTPKVDYVFKGVNGEQRGGDVIGHTLKIYTQDGGAWKEAWSGIYTQITQLSNVLNKAAYTGRVAVEAVDTAYTIGKHKGISTSRIEFDMTKADFTAPVLNMINVRDGKDKIVESLKTADEGMIELYAADFEFKMVQMMGYEKKNVKSVKVEYADHGSGKFMELPVKHNAKRDINRFWGQNFTASLKDMKKESNDGWFDLRATVTDADGNTYTMTAAPAFFIESLVGVKAIGTENAEIDFKEGIISAEGANIQIYDLTGKKIAEGINSVDVRSLVKSVYIVKAISKSGVTSKKIIVR